MWNQRQPPGFDIQANPRQRRFSSAEHPKTTPKHIFPVLSAEKEIWGVNQSNFISHVATGNSFVFQKKTYDYLKLLPFYFVSLSDGVCGAGRMKKTYWLTSPFPSLISIQIWNERLQNFFFSFFLFFSFFFYKCLQHVNNPREGQKEKKKVGRN